MKLLALDLATMTGWAIGEIGERPMSGSVQLGKRGASIEAVSGALLKWSLDFLMEYKPEAIVWEAPIMLPHDTTDILDFAFGLPVIVGAVAYQLGIHSVRKASVKQVRAFWIGMPNAKREIAKDLVIKRCQFFGFDPKDDNEADALAVWHFQAALTDPAIGSNVTPLFGGKQR
jgi:hypothetical protein